ncbi:hypothetical protein AC249_AIPGENE1861 [Exaiptasia diaphana]|nr:hypothetical protein AC249_AIPGENE1861 [Exaiptasia diaphana]
MLDETIHGVFCLPPELCDEILLAPNSSDVSESANELERAKEKPNIKPSTCLNVLDVSKTLRVERKEDLDRYLFYT